MQKAEIGKKLEALFYEWARRGRLSPEHIAGNRININDSATIVLSKC